MDKRNIRRVAYFSTGILLLAVFIFVSRGPYISNTLKKIILPELENMTGRKVTAQKIYLNVFPLFVEAKGLKVFDDEGNKILTAERVKGYVGLSGIFRKEIILKRLILKSPEIWTDRRGAEDIVDRVGKYLSVEGKNKIKVSVNAIELRDGGISFHDAENHAVISVAGLGGEALLGETPRVKAQIKELVTNIKGMPVLKSEVKTAFVFKKDGIDIKNITFSVFDSEMRASGFYSPDKKGALSVDMELVVDSIKKVLGLKQRGEGKITAKGDIRLDGGEPFLDMSLKGDFYLQTLMEVLKVNEKLEGLVNFSGKVNGRLSGITGSADARLRKGNIYGVEIDDVKCGVSYKDGVLAFKDGVGLFYNGRGEAELSLKLPEVDYYALRVKFTDVDSKGAFKLIGWDPGIPKGKVRGELYTSGSEFDPAGWFEYENREAGNDILGRVKKAKGTFIVKGPMLSLPDLEVKTERSTLGASGALDMTASILNLKTKLSTIDVRDITMPYFSHLIGSGDFTGEVTGKFDDPLIDGRVNIISASYDGHELGSISGGISYRKVLLDVRDLTAGAKGEHYGIKGSINFDRAKEPFDFKSPDYKLAVSVKNADIEKLAGIFYKRLPVKGKVDSDFRIAGAGPAPALTGSARITDMEAYKFSLDSALIGFDYNFRELSIKKALLKKNNSVLAIEGNLKEKDRFSFKASAEGLAPADFGLKGMPADASVDIDAEGSGAFDDPYVSIEGKINGGTHKGKPLGSGSIKASIKNKDARFIVSLFNERVKFGGRAQLNDTLPWSANLDISAGRYDFLLSALLKDVPEDLLLNLKARAEFSGDRKNFSASAVVDQLNIALFGYGFSNDSDIKINIDNRNMSFSAFTMRSGSASFSLKGNMEIGREYNIVLEGNSSLAPLKGLSGMISALRGDADFTLAVSGKWESPQVNGGLNVTNGLFGLKDIHQRISSINGYFYFDEDKIVVQKMTGKLGGGDMEASGIVYLKGFSIKRFFLDAKLNNITTSISKDFTVNFNGDIVYKGTPDSQVVTGEVKVNRSRYRERVEWKSWLLKARAREKPKLEPTRLEKAGLNIKIYGAENILVDNNIARTPLKVDMVLRGTIGHPLLFGRVESRGGKVYFRNNEFTILSASADFADPNRINPLMEIVAETIVKGYNIKLSLEGQLEHFNLSLVSDPPLEETDILSLLTVGQMGKELKGLEGGIGAGEAAAFLTGKVQDIFEDRLKNITGLDRVQVDPYVSKSTGTIGPRVTVSKRLLGERLFVTYISSVGSTEEQVLKMEYILGRNVSLVGVRDEKGSVGGDIKFRFEFK